MQRIERPARLAGVCSLLAAVGTLAVSAAGAQAAATPIGPGGAGTTCDPNTNGSNVAQLCGVYFTTVAGNPATVVRAGVARVRR